MDNRTDSFTGGFIAGAVFGGVVGGLLGSFLGARLSNDVRAETEPLIEGEAGETKPRIGRRRPFQAASELSIEEARQGLEVKITQLNEAIDDVRQQLSNVNGNAPE